MSVIVKSPKGAIYLFSKGADAEIKKRLSDKVKKSLLQATENDLSTFSKQGLRYLFSFSLWFRSVF